MEVAVILIIALLVVAVGMLYHCGTESIIEEELTRRRIAYETRDDATIKTFDDDLELEKKRTADNHNDEENPTSSVELNDSSNTNTHTNSMTEHDDDMDEHDEIIIHNNTVNDGKTKTEPSESSETPPSVIIVEMESASSTSDNDDHDDDIADIENGDLESSVPNEQQ